MKLYIIGNGFDLAHGIRSSYKDFENFMSARYIYEMSLIEPLFESSKTDLWADFENALGRIEPNVVIRTVEAEARTNEPEDIGHQSNFMTDTVSQACDSLQTVFESHFAEWVSQIDITVAEKLFPLNSSAYYFTFNYTETLENIYSIPETNVLHIHNCRNCRHNAPPIVGHGNNRFIPFTGEEWIATDEINDSIQQLFSQTRKDVLKNISHYNSYFNSLNKIDEVFVYGHSLNDIDLPYFQEIQRNIAPVSSWTVSYYDNSEKTQFPKILCNKIKIPMTQIQMVTL